MEGLAIRVEQALLGAVLLDPAGQQRVLDLVEQDDMLGIRRRVHLAGSRLVQAGESGEAHAVAHQAAWVRDDLDACSARWLALPEQLRGQAPPVLTAHAGHRDAAGRAAAVREEIRRLRGEVSAGREVVGEQIAALARQVAQAATAAATSWERRAPGRDGRPHGEVVEAAGLKALRDLAAGPSQLEVVREWLQPQHFAVPDHGELYAAMTRMSVAGRPVDPVTLSWEAARQGLRVEPDALAGGTGAFAVASAREVRRAGVCAQAAQAGRDIQAAAVDLSRPPQELLPPCQERLPPCQERLRALDVPPQPVARPAGGAQVIALAPGRRAVRQAERPGKEAAP